MANEAVIIELLGNKGDPVRYTCASGTAIVKGEILKFSDPRTAAIANTSGSFFAGIAAADKQATDQSTTVSAYTNGIFDLIASGAIGVGEGCFAAGQNKVSGDSTCGQAPKRLVGVALETAANAERIAVRVLR